MHSTKDFLFNQRELLPSGKLPFAGEAGKARQVVDVSFRPPDPVGRVDVPPAAGAAGAVPPATTKDVQGEGTGPLPGARGWLRQGPRQRGCGSAAQTRSKRAACEGGGDSTVVGFLRKKKIKKKNQQVCIW